MENVFLTVCHLAVVASFVMAAVMAVRLLLKKAPKIFTMLLWGLVALRLILPFSVESAFSLVPKQVAHTEPAAVTTAVPVARAMTVPLWLTDATAGSEEAKLRFAAASPFTCAVSVAR